MSDIKKSTTIKVVDKKDKVEIIRIVEYENDEKCIGCGYDKEIAIEKSFIPELIKTLQKIIGEK